MTLPIGFNMRDLQKREEMHTQIERKNTPVKSVVLVNFPSENCAYSYYNDSFDLHIGDIVYVDGKLEGVQGEVVEVNYSFKIKLADYKKVIAVAESDFHGEFYFLDSHFVSFDRTALPYEKVLLLYKAPEPDDGYESGNDGTSFPLNDLAEMNISKITAEKGHDYYMRNAVSYIALSDGHGKAIVSGSQNYEVEFDFSDGNISNLTCSCFCSAHCKHEFATMLQLREILDNIFESYNDKYNGYFAAMYRNDFVTKIMFSQNRGKFELA